jgi:hypothetical protein
MGKSELLNPEVLKDQNELTDEQHEEIRENAMREVNKERKARESDEDDEDPFKDPPSKKDTGSKKDEGDTEDEPNEEEDSEKKEEDKGDGESKKKEKDEEKLAQETEKAEKAKKVEAARKKEEDQRTDNERELIKEADASEAEAKKQEFEADVEEYAEALGVSEAQARKDMEKIRGVSEKYKGNPKEMAKALYHAAVKLSQAHQRLSAIDNQLKPGQLVIGGKKLSEEESREYLIKVYREHYAELSEGMDDDKVHKLAMKELTAKMQEIRERQYVEMKSGAEKKRHDLLEALPEVDKRFVKDVKASLSRVNDSEVLSEDFDLEDLLRHARGRNYHKDVKDAYERGKSDAIKEKKILGKKPEDTSGGGSGGAKKISSFGLTDSEKDQALDMYNMPISDEEKFKLFSDYKKSISKKKKE